MSTYCAPCKRSFNGHRGLDQHLQNSPKHRSPAQSLPLAVTSVSSTSQVTIPAVQTTAQRARLPWSTVTVPEYTAVLDELSAHCHSLKELEEHGYITRPYNPLDYANAGKCKRCHCRQTRRVPRECTFHPSKRMKGNRGKSYVCCGTDGKGCTTLPAHDFHLPLHAFAHKDFRQTPAASAEPRFRAVALDCEMAGVAGGAGEAILLCATDYITGAVLVNRLVCPRERITQMRTQIHGIKKSALDEATSQGQALAGWEEARSELWKCIDDNTILVGHALKHDLSALRMIHPRVVDSGILSGNAVGCRTQLGLQKLCSELLGIEIRKGKGGIHNCLEDVLATREVVLFCTRARNKEAFQAWVEAKKREERRLEMIRELAKQKKANERRRRGAAGSEGGNRSFTDFHEDDEVLHWSDIAEDLGWPHPDTGYDPWSD
ncbi:putative RNA exonuclease 3 [Rosellinia necatrix]|uniref:Putative RNA exonuclease 3 n=1 Tax=Rosellinia necatrix TaxID=77044 RepID=A0A1W2THR0_ROSNE|nr:putative RNA exonuclease 3 [Rosellinia necatrix]